MVIVHDEVWLPYRDQSGWIMTSLIYSIFLLIFLLLLANVRSINGLTNNSVASDTAVQLESYLQLQQIRQALIAWSVSSANPGMLPCPEDSSLIGTANEGSAQSNCSNQLNLGHLPWRTLGLGKIQDSHGDAFWYAVSAGFCRSPVNSNQPANIDLDGQSMAAIVIAPGRPLTGQVRLQHEQDPLQFLDQQNADGDTHFNSLTKCTGCNDLIIGLSKDQLFASVQPRVLQEIRGNNSFGLMRFWNQSAYFPFADMNQDSIADEGIYQGYVSYSGDANSLVFYSASSWLKKNNWFSLVRYQLSPNQKKVTLILNQQSLEVSP